MLRLRTLVYCLVALGTFTLSLLGDTTDWAEARGQGKPISAVNVLGFTWDGGMAGLYAFTAVYLLRARPDRRRLVVLVTTLTLIVTAASAPLEGFSALLEAPEGGIGRAARAHAAWMSVYSATFVSALAMVLVPMSRKELARVVVPGCIIAWVSILAIAQPPVMVGVVQCVAAAAGMCGGAVWSAWRFREFDERFRSREVAAQLGDMSAELSYARRIHEALFPPEIEQGPVRMRYRYEPMRAIGGDFLFVWPLAFPPSETAGAVHIVIIDVSGHGVSAALTVNRLHDELRRFFAEHPEGGAGKLIEDLNGFVAEHLALHGVFATALAMRFDPAASEVEWASAGHPPAFVALAKGIEDLGATAPMLGVLGRGEFEAQAQRTRLGVGERVVAFTDGAFEGLDKTGKTAGVGALRDVIRKVSEPRTVAAEVAGLRGEAAGDDLLVVEAWMNGG